MKSSSINKRIKRTLNEMFDTHYQVSVLTAHPGNIDYEEVLSEKDGLQLKVKHLAAYIAMATLESDYTYKNKNYFLKKIAQQFRNDSKEIVSQMNEAFSFLMEEVVRLN